MISKSLKLYASIIVALILMMALMIACAPTEEPVARSYGCAVYTEQGCAKFVVASGGEIEIQSGGTFDLQSGATVDFSGGVDLDGSTLTFDGDGDTTMVASDDDVITATINSGTGYLVISTGNLKVGDGSPSTAQDGEDAYVEGGFEVDGTARFDGAVALNSTLDMSNGAIINIGAAGTDFSTDGGLTTALGITVTTGGLTVNAGGATITGSVAGSSDVDVGTWLNFSAQSAISVTADAIITPTGTYQPLTSWGAITCSTTSCVADGSETGDMLILRNANAADVITIDGTGGNVECKANVALGASDTLTLIWNGSDWNCLSNYDNS